MIGIVLTAIGAFFQEAGSSIGKWEALHKKEGLFVMGFLNLFWGLVFFWFINIFAGGFIFSAASLPTLIPRIFLEIVQVHIGLLAMIKADRSAIGFITVGTIPLLLLADLSLGYRILPQGLVGISVVVLVLLFLFINRGIKGKGIGYVIFVTLNAVVTISLFKYNITHFNSVSAEQGIIYLFLVAYFAIGAFILSRVNPFKYLAKYPFSIQGLTSGLAGVFISFAFLFAPASVITTAKRAFTVLGTVISGKIYFKEKNFAIKLAAFLATAVGIALMS
ncbi:MAG: hypothetical protein Q8P52_02750 [bacterium]|nr:hypothetical protein [bacterium]